MCILQFAINQLASLSYRACRKTKKKKKKRKDRKQWERQQSKRYILFVLNKPTNPHLNLAQVPTVDTTVFTLFIYHSHSYINIYRYRLFQLTFFQLTRHVLLSCSVFISPISFLSFCQRKYICLRYNYFLGFEGGSECG